MKLTRAIAVLLLLCAAALTSAQTKKPDPSDGAVTAGVYHNAYFGFEYQLPAGFADRTAAMPKLAGGSYGLLHASEPQQPTRYASSVTLFADDVKGWQVKSGAEYLDKFGAQMQRSSDLVGKMTSFALGGHTFYRQDFSRRGVAARQTVVATVIKGFVLSAVLNASDPARIEALVAGFRAAKFRPSH